MIVAIGYTNPVKINAVKAAFKKVFSRNRLRFVGVAFALARFLHKDLY